MTQRDYADAAEHGHPAASVRAEYRHQLHLAAARFLAQKRAGGAVNGSNGAAAQSDSNEPPPTIDQDTHSNGHRS